MKLPLNCEAEYLEKFMTPSDADALYAELNQLLENTQYKPQTIDGINVEVNFNKIMFIDQELKDANKFPEQFWGPSRVWTNKLRDLKQQIEQHTGHQFQVCVLIYYPDGTSGVDYHSDYVAYGDTTVIPSISLGEERVFCLREKDTGEVFSQQLKHGSLIVMGKDCQKNYEHALPEDPKYKSPRINLTFRKFGFED